jgi:CHASE1-domain containing sensor protein
MEKSFGKILKQPTAKKLLPYLVLAVLLVLSVLALQYYEQAIMEREARRYNDLVNRIADEITDQLHKYEMILLGGAGIFVASEEVTREEWRAYSEYRQVSTHYPGIHRITVSRVVQPAELAQHIEEIRAEGFPDYTVWPEGEREIYTPAIYLEPFDALSRRAFGYDIFSEPVRRSAMEQADVPVRS